MNVGNNKRPSENLSDGLWLDINVSAKSEFIAHRADYAAALAVVAVVIACCNIFAVGNIVSVDLGYPVAIDIITGKQIPYCEDGTLALECKEPEAV